MDFSVPMRGLLTGLTATFAMMAPEAVAYRQAGSRAVMEWEENQKIASRLTGRPVSDSMPLGLALHFLHGGLAGMMFAVAVSLTGLQPLSNLAGSVAAALAFGFMLFLIGLAIHKPITGRRPGGHAASLNLVNHMVYGLVLGALAVIP